MGVIVTFGVSGGALLFFIAFKVFENRYPIHWYVRLRKKGDIVVRIVVLYLRKKSTLVEENISMHSMVRLFVRIIARGVARIAHVVEIKAHAVTHMTMRRTEDGNIRTKSLFLQKVATHKKGLDTERIKRETSLTSDIRSTEE